MILDFEIFSISYHLFVNLAHNICSRLDSVFQEFLECDLIWKASLQM